MDGSNPFADWGQPQTSVGEPASGLQPDPTPRPDALSGSPRRTTRLALLAAIALAAALGGVLVVRLGGGSGSSSPVSLASSPLGARTFTTAIPPHWQVSMSFPTAGATDYQLASPNSPVRSGDVLPPIGTIMIQIVDFPPASVAQGLGPHAASQSPSQLLAYGFEPPGAMDIVHSVLPHRTSLGGVPAAGDSYTYTYKGRPDVQSQLVARRGGEVVSIQIDAEPSLVASATSALNTIVARWHWITPAADTRAASPQPPAAAGPPIGPTPSGQWVASGFIDAVVGDFANAHLDQPEVRAWNFGTACATPTTCHKELVVQLMYGATALAQLERLPHNAWWAAVFPVSSGWCAREASRRTPKETIRDTIQMGWSSPAHHELIAQETETITGCGGPGSSTLGTHWTVVPVPAPATPQISLNPSHASTAAVFRTAARRVCTRLNARALPFASRIGAAQRTLRTATSRTARATAEVTIAKQLAPLLPLSVSEYTQIPQPPIGPLDALWLRDIGLNRQQLAPAAAAMSALEAAAIAGSRYLRTGAPLQLQTVITEGTLYAEDLTRIRDPARASNAIERTLRLPAICTNPPAIGSIFTAPTIA